MGVEKGVRNGYVVNCGFVSEGGNIVRDDGDVVF